MLVKHFVSGLILLAIACPCAFAHCKDPQTQLEMNVCAHEDYMREDKALNSIYRTYRSGLNAQEQKMLKDAQAQWIKFRDLSCTFEASAVEGGSMQPMVHSMCLRDYTSERRNRLEGLASCKYMPNPGKGCAE